jgi:N-acetylneuraminic acid mutarotase
MGKGRDKKKKLKKKDGTAPVKEQKTNLKKQNSLEDIDKLLEEFKEATQIQTQVEQNCEPPSRRANCSLTVNPINTNELILFGGEYFDGKRVEMYNDFYKYNIEKNEWKRIICPEMPGPRSSHQIAITQKGMLYLFGGEFVSPNETNFFHYKDFWKMNLAAGNIFERVDVKVKPNTRSGHRMVCWKEYLVLFGGFFDQIHKTTYFDDLWVFNTLSEEWTKIETQEKPLARSGCQLMIHHDLLTLYGGYSKISKKGTKTIGMMHTDHWVLKLGPELKFQWEKKKKIGGVIPGPRSGGTMIYHKDKGFMFGGVSDILEDEEQIESVMHADMFQFNLDQNKFYPTNVKKKDSLMPCARFNASLCVAKNVMYMFGGILEVGDKEITLSDLWSLNLDKLQEWNRVIEDDNEEIDWDNELSSSEDEDEDQEDGESNDDSEEEAEQTEDAEVVELDTIAKRKLERFEKIKLKQEKKQTQMTPEDLKEQSENDPRPMESMSDFYIRTTEYWQKEAMKEVERTGKTLRRKGFTIAYDRYLFLRPTNEVIEEQIIENEIEDGGTKVDSKDFGESRNRNR